MHTPYGRVKELQAMMGDKASNKEGPINWTEHALLRALSKLFGKKD